MTEAWIEKKRASVSWGDKIHEAVLPSGATCCWFEVEGQRHYLVPGSLADLSGSLALAKEAQALPECDRATVLFLDWEATEYQVEEAFFVLGREGVGCGFLEGQPEAIHHHLLFKASEGTVLVEALKRLRGEANG